MKSIAVCIQNENQKVTPIQTIEAIKKAGYKDVFIQWYDENWKCTQQEQVDVCKKLGLNIIFAHLGYQNINEIWNENETGEELVERYKNDIKECKQNGITLVIMHLTKGFQAPLYNEIGLRRIKEIVDYAQELGVKVAFENLRIQGYLEYVFQHIDNDNIGICYDAGHCHTYFDDKFPYELFKDKIFAVHLHDNYKTDDLHLLPFDGTIDWKYVINKLKECNYRGPITLELCYRYQYLDISLEEFYKKGYEIGKKLNNIYDELS